MLTVKQAALQLGVSPALVYALVAARKIRHERHGLGRGAIRIAPEALEEYRRRRTVEADEDGGTAGPAEDVEGPNGTGGGGGGGMRRAGPGRGGVAHHRADHGAGPEEL